MSEGRPRDRAHCARAGGREGPATAGPDTDVHGYRLGLHGLEQVHSGEVFVLAGAYVPEGEWDEGELSGDEFCGYFDDFVELLSAHYGEPVYGEEELLYSESGQDAAHWQVGDIRLVLQTYRNYGDGDIDNRLWLAAVRS